MTESTKRTGLDLRILLVIALALVLGLIGAGVWALNTNTDLESTRATLAISGSASSNCSPVSRGRPLSCSVYRSRSSRSLP